jgi:ketosteroid isomerase-like protein
MSEDNVEVVRRWYALFSDAYGATPDDVRERIDQTFRDFGDEQFEARLDPDYPEGEQVFRGREGAMQLFTMLRGVWGEFRFEPKRFLDAGDRVLVFIRLVAKGGASGVPIELKTAHVWTVRDGRLTSVRFYRDRSKALEAAGLSE